MEVLLISNMYPSNLYPSYGIFVKNFEDALVEKNITVKKVVLTKEKSKIKKIIKYIKFYLDIFIKLIIKKHDLVYVHYASHTAIPIIFANKFRKINLFTNVHGSDVVPEKKSQFKYQKYVKKMLEVSQTVIVPSEYFKSLVESKYKISKDKIVISPSGGVNEEKFYFIENKENLRSKYNIDNNSFIIGYVGRIDIGKGWDIFLKSLKVLVDTNKIEGKVALVIGSGSQLNDFNRMVDDLNLSKYIIRLDLLPQGELINIYNIIDVFCFPTTRDGESLGLVGLEAMMCGVPVIGSKVGALPEYIIESKTGKLIEKFNYIELSNKILDIYEEVNKNKIRKLEYTTNCIKKAREYESKIVNEGIYSLITNRV